MATIINPHIPLPASSQAQGDAVIGSVADTKSVTPASESASASNDGATSNQNGSQSQTGSNAAQILDFRKSGKLPTSAERSGPNGRSYGVAASNSDATPPSEAANTAAQAYRQQQRLTAVLDAVAPIYREIRLGGEDGPVVELLDKIPDKS